MTSCVHVFPRQFSLTPLSFISHACRVFKKCRPEEKMKCDDCGGKFAINIPEEGQALCNNCTAKLLREVSAICPRCADDFSPTIYGQACCDRCAVIKKADVKRNT